MAIKTCPECGATVENSQTCPQCGYSFKRKVNMGNVHATLEAIERYDKKTAFLNLLWIPTAVFLILSFFTKMIFFAVALIFPICYIVLNVIVMLNRPKFILSVCIDKYSLISFIKEQNKNTSSVLSDTTKAGAASVAGAFTVECNPEAKKLLRKFVIASSILPPSFILLLVTGLLLSLGNCEGINVPFASVMDTPSTGAPILLILVTLLISIIVCLVINKKFNQLMPIHVDKWLKQQKNIEEDETPAEAIPVSNNGEKTAANSSSDDEFDLSSFDFGDL